MAKLSPKEKAFCREYIKRKNALQAAIAAGYSPKTAKAKSFSWLEKVGIKTEIARLEKKANQTDEAAIIDRNRIIREWDKIAFRNAKTIYDENDEMKPMSKLSEEDAACISEVMELQTEIGHSRKVKFFSKEQALKELSKLGGLYPEEGTGEAKNIVYVFGDEKD